MTESPNYYAIIPAVVRYDKDLMPNAKLLYGEITALCNAKGYCWASTEYFANLYGVNKVSIQRWLRSLEENGYIHREVVYKEGTKEIEKRSITICNNPSNKNVTTPLQKRYNPSNKNVTDNITSNNTNNNTSNKAAAAERDNKQYIVKSLETWQKLWLFPNLVQRDDLERLIDIYGDDLVDAAIKVAGSKDVPKGRAINFIEACLREWTDASVKTVEEAREYQKKRGNSKPSSYQKQSVRKEKLPYWAQDGYEYKEKHMTKAEIEEMRASATRGIERN